MLVCLVLLSLVQTCLVCKDEVLMQRCLVGPISDVDKVTHFMVSREHDFNNLSGTLTTCKVESSGFITL